MTSTGEAVPGDKEEIRGEETGHYTAGKEKLPKILPAAQADSQ